MRFFTLFLAIQLLGKSSNGQACVFNDTSGSGQILDLRALAHIVLTKSDGENRYVYQFTPCRNGNQCTTESGTQTAMTIQRSGSDEQCYVLANWDNGKVQPMYDSVDQTWKFEYANGPDCFGAPKQFYAYFNCDLTAGDYKIISAGEITSCTYEMYIDTQWACGENYTTTTTSIPSGSCEWKSEDGQHTLNMSAVAGNSLATANNDNTSLFYVYTPCSNTLRCDNNTFAMSFLIDKNSFQCNKYLAIWENGINEPKYSDQLQSWQFVYTNGEMCSGFENVFIVNWNCDMTKKTPLVVKAEKSGECLYQMIINSSLACN